MGSIPFTFHVRLVRSPAFAHALYRADALLCAILCGLIHSISWSIAVAYFLGWCLYRLIRGLIWVIDQVSMICVYTVGIIWIILVWVGTRFVRVVILLMRLLRHLGRALRRGAGALIRWAIREFGEPVICAACVYLGVLSTSMLPLAVVLQLAPAAAVSVVLSPLAAFAITARVFDIRAYNRWQRGARVRLGARVLRAYSDGVMWGVWLRRPRVVSQSAAC